ncbi:MAG: hypothetical protein ACTSO7_06635 [Candidatus Heimdallarchaeota archaeon]
MSDLINEVKNRCPDGFAPCSITFKIGESMHAFDEVVKIFTTAGFEVKDFVSDHMCVLSRDRDGVNEAVKVKDTTIQIQASQETLLDLCKDLKDYCIGLE